MPHCYICDKEIDKVLIDRRDLKPRPCSECEEIISEVVQSYNELEDGDYPLEEDDIHEQDLGEIDLEHT